jgi:acyl-CoA synthetase (AMP-forming)/AMP-acid ligase II
VTRDDGAELVGFYTGTPQPDRELIAWLRDYLPIQLVPRTLHHRESLPLNVNGKIDRHALRG